MSRAGGPPTYVSLGPAEAERLARALEAAGWVRKEAPTNPHERVRGRAEGAVFVVWASGKVAYQGPRARALLEDLLREAGLGPGEGTEVGSDEAGKGEWLGPLVVAAVALRPAEALALRLDGVRDSKELAEAARDRLAGAIRARAAAHRVVVIGPRRFNELWETMHARGETLNDLLWWAHRTALAPVLEAVKGDPSLQVVLDEFDRTRRAEAMFGAALPPGARVEQRPRAGDAVAVGAASILARSARDAEVRALAARWDLPEDLAPEAARVHPRAADFAKLAWLKPPPT